MRSLIILPTYNERENIGTLIPKIFEILPETSVLVVDDSSPDKTADLVRELVGKYPNLILFQREQKEGLGRAYLAAFKKILSEFRDFDFVVMMDADWSHDPKHLPGLLSHMENLDFVIGSRYVAGGGIDGWELWRKLLSYGGNIYSRLILRKSIRDWTGGFNCVRLSAIERLDLTKLYSFTGYAFEIAFKYYLAENKLKFKEVPIIFRERSKGGSKISQHIIREGLWAPLRLVLGF